MDGVGYCFAVLIGFTLGLIGGGGSILLIPALVFCFGIEPVLATTYSLFIVGLTAFTGSLSQSRAHTIEFKTVIMFGIPSVIALFIMRRLFLPLVPPVIYHSGGLVVSKSFLIMVVFSILMIVAGISMIRQKKYQPSPERQSTSRLALQGAMTGLVTGFIGIGGGFIIVPSLVLFAGLTVKRAIATSLTIITINCVVGIFSNLEMTGALNYTFLLAFAVLAMLGILAGTRVTGYIPEKKLKLLFGWIILAMSLIVILRIFIHY